jgi:hypothetical protein
MAGNAQEICSNVVNDSAVSAWIVEIRDYLLGRLSKHARPESLNTPQVTVLFHAPIRRWWIFEGKKYAPLDGTLVAKADLVGRMAKRVLETFNPRFRLSERPDGIVDWGQTFSRGLNAVGREYVIASSGVGLNEQERDALSGWVRWIKQEWEIYANTFQLEKSVEWPNLDATTCDSFPSDRLDRWARVARRSRWPLLNGVVAESLRPCFEPDELKRIPLPTDRATLFELLCLVRIAKCISSAPGQIRWLLAEEDNELKLDNARILFQRSLPREDVLNTYDCDLVRAIEHFGVSIPKRVDLIVEFERDRAGFAGLIAEAKSGSQAYHDALPQLKTYRSALRRKQGGRYLLWGIVENAPIQEHDALLHLQQHFSREYLGSDAWVFSSADAIEQVLTCVGISVAAHSNRIN